MANTVTIFNANPQTIAFVINNGQQFSVSGAGPAQNWAPQAGTGPACGHTPQPNVIGKSGQNFIMAYVNGSPVGNPFTFSLPHGLPVNSVQIYCFLAHNQTATWIVLTDGQVCAHS